MRALGRVFPSDGRDAVSVTQQARQAAPEHLGQCSGAANQGLRMAATGLGSSTYRGGCDAINLVGHFVRGDFGM